MKTLLLTLSILLLLPAKTIPEKRQLGYNIELSEQLIEIDRQKIVEYNYELLRALLNIGSDTYEEDIEILRIKLENQVRLLNEDKERLEFFKNYK